MTGKSKKSSATVKVLAWEVRAIRIAKLDRAVEANPSADIPPDDPAFGPCLRARPARSKAFGAARDRLKSAAVGAPAPSGSPRSVHLPHRHLCSGWTAADEPITGMDTTGEAVRIRNALQESS